MALLVVVFGAFLLLLMLTFLIWDEAGWVERQVARLACRWVGGWAGRLGRVESEGTAAIPIAHVVWFPDPDIPHHAVVWSKRKQLLQWHVTQIASRIQVCHASSLFSLRGFG